MMEGSLDGRKAAKVATNENGLRQQGTARRKIAALDNAAPYNEVGFSFEHRRAAAG
jgi:hypothetical protein